MGPEESPWGFCQKVQGTIPFQEDQDALNTLMKSSEVMPDIHSLKIHGGGGAWGGPCQKLQVMVSFQDDQDA